MIKHNRPTLGKEEEAAAVRVVRSGWVAQGEEVACFEDEFCDYLGLQRGHAVAVSSGTAALYLVLMLLGVENHTVAFPAYTCTAVRNAVAHSGGIPIVVDSSKETPNISVHELNQRSPSFAVIPHMYGFPVDISGINNSIVVIEDCAQALGAKYHGNSVGIQGKAGIFSFYATKIITSGGAGGMIVSRDESLIEAARDYRDFDQKIDDIRRFNFQMTDIQAAIGREQLKKLPAFLEKRKYILEMYKKEINKKIMSMLQEGQVPYRCIVLTDDVEIKIHQLENKGISAINPFEERELLDDGHLHKNAYRWTQTTLSIPIYPSLEMDEINKIIFEVSNL